MEALLQLAFSALNVANTALTEMQKLRDAEATGDQSAIDTARQAATDRANAIADELRAG